MRKLDARQLLHSVNYFSTQLHNLMMIILSQERSGRFLNQRWTCLFTALHLMKTKLLGSTHARLLRTSRLSRLVLATNLLHWRLQLFCWIFIILRRTKSLKLRQLWVFRTFANWILLCSRRSLNRLELRISVWHLPMHQPGFSKLSWRWSILL